MLKLSIIIVNFNGGEVLNTCLDHLNKQEFKNYELIIFDNGSKDFTVKSFLGAKNFKIINSKKNLGYAKANNLALKETKGEYVLLLNNDVYLEKNTIGNLVKFLDENKNIGICQPKIIQQYNKNKIDSCGSYWTDSTLLYHYANGTHPLDLKVLENKKIFSAMGACLMFKRSVLENNYLFDDKFWCYFEETDFCIRAQLLGWEVWYCSDAICHHIGSLTSKKFNQSIVQFHNFKNKLRTYLKVFSLKKIIMYTLAHLVVLIISSLFFLTKMKFKTSIMILKSITWNLVNLRDTLELRKFFFSHNLKTNENFLKLKVKLNFKYLLWLIKG